MIHLTRDTPIVLGIEPADFRAGVDGFAARTRERLGRDPHDGTLYVYINRSKTMIRALGYEDNGYWLMTKRLSKGRFGGWPTGETAMTPATLPGRCARCSTAASAAVRATVDTARRPVAAA